VTVVFLELDCMNKIYCPPGLTNTILVVVSRTMVSVLESSAFNYPLNGYPSHLWMLIGTHNIF